MYIILIYSPIIKQNKMNRSLYKILFFVFIGVLICTRSYAANFQPSFADTLNPEQETNIAHQLLSEIQQTRNFINHLDHLSTVDLPVGLTAKEGKEAEKYAIIITDIIFRHGKAYLNAYMAFTVPGSDKKIAFRGRNIPFTHSGGIQGEAMLELIGDVEIPISESVDIRLKGATRSQMNTFVAWDCAGFKTMNLVAEVLFDSNVFLPENEDGSLKTGEQLKTSFQLQITDWNNLMIGISLDPFQIKPLKGVGIKVTNAILDLNDFENPIGATFPNIYNTMYFQENSPLTWRGIYLKEVEVRMPSQFKNKNRKERVTFFGKNLLIDELGITGFLGVENLLMLSEGDMNGWNFSVEDLAIELQASQLISAGFHGKLQVPMFSDSSMFNYTAIMGSNNDYLFNVAVEDTLDMPVWSANLNLHPNSAIDIAVVKDKFMPVLHLNGDLTLNSPIDPNDEKSKTLKLSQIEFQGLHIQTIKPYVSIDYISFGKRQDRFSDFPVSIYKVGFKSDSTRLGLMLGLNVNFMGEGDGGFAGAGLFTIWGEENDGKWKYEGVEVDKIIVDIEKSDAYKLYGEVAFIRGDEKYGNGFKGILDADFAGFAMQATGLFGNVDGFRYWYADAMISTPAGIPAGPVSMYGFGGGAFQRVKQAGVDESQSSSIGQTRSGIVYEPDKNSGLGLMASVKFGLTGNKNTLNGDVKFGISFTSSGGLNQIAFNGNAYFVTNNFNVLGGEILENAKHLVKDNGSIPMDTKRAQIFGNINMLFDFPNKSFHSNFNIYMNVAGGMIRGVNEGGLAGWGVVHFAPDDWYIHLGTPDKPNGISILGIAKMTNYFMAGKNVPELPPPPEKIISFLNKRGERYPTERTGEVFNGKGLALGAAFEFDTGERTFLIFYGRFGCGVGFDILLKNYEDNVTCKDREGPIGINGWYAQGQAYAWIAAEVGIKIKLPFYSGKYSIFDVEVAALLQAQLPNPFWMKGNVAGRYSILNGLVNGHCDFEFEIGEKCKMVSSSPFDGVPVISELKPGDKMEDVSVFTTPQIVFNMPIDREFEFQNENKVTKKFKVNLREFSIKAKDGRRIDGNLSWNERSDVATFKSKDILPGETEVTLIASVSFEEYKNGAWFEVKQDGKTAIESKQAVFTTGPEPDHIPQHNVAFGFPSNKQFNYYQKESDSNYLALNSGQPKLFNPGSEWQQVVRVKPVANGQFSYATLSYDNAKSTVNFNLPQNLNPNTVYSLEIVNIPARDATAVDANVKQKINTVATGDTENESEVKVKTQYAESARSELQEKVIYSMAFRTSNFNTFTEKMDRLQYSEGITWEIAPLTHSITLNIQGERFDANEVENLIEGKQIDVTPIWQETNWFNTELKSLIILDDAKLSKIGMTPFNPPGLTSYLFQADGTRLLTDEEIASGNVSNTQVLSGMKNYLARYSIHYLYNLKNNIATTYANKPVNDSQFSAILNARFPHITNGTYPIKINYYLPGQNKENTIYDFEIQVNE